MTTGLSLENLARVIHADKQRNFTQERFVRQVELAQAQIEQVSYKTHWGTTIKGVNAHQLVITMAVRPF